MKLVQSTYHVLCVDNNRDNCSILNIRGEKKSSCASVKLVCWGWIYWDMFVE